MNEFIGYVLAFFLVALIVYLRPTRKEGVYRRKPERPFPAEWRKILQDRVPFYTKLTSADKKRLEEQMHYFLVNVKISGKDTVVTHLDRVLVAAGASIPVFRFKKWHYTNLNEVVIFPQRFQVPETTKMASGLVGWGAMQGKMWLSRKALYKGFHYDNDHKNVAIHEFVHLMDMQDGRGDGIIEETMHPSDIKEWNALIKKKAREIVTDNSSIREYASENPVEFLAVTAEFYFEDPEKMKKEHPNLYRKLDQIFVPKGY